MRAQHRDMTWPMLALTASLACTGTIQESSGAGAGETGTPRPRPGQGSASGQPGGVGGPGAAWMSGGDPQAAPALPLRLLTRKEYDHTIQLVFGDEYGVLPAGGVAATANLPGESVDVSGFLATTEITETHAQRLAEAASIIGAAIAPSLDRLVGCALGSASTDDAACIARFLPGFAELLYRRPLSPAELEAHLAFYREERTMLGQTAPAAARQLVEAMLQSPHFLYRWERGWEVAERQGDVVRLNDYQVASRLAFMLWASGPDRALLRRARDGELSRPEGLREAVRDLLAHPRAARALDWFHTQWLGLGEIRGLFKDRNRFPQWNEALAASMQREVELFTRHVMTEGDGTVATLLRAPYGFADERLAAVYGLSGVTGGELRRVELDPTERAGLLTLPGLLAASSEASVPNPFRRGKLVLNRLLCLSLEPPAEIPMPPHPDPDDPRSERQVLEELTAAPACAGCHRQINPLGFALDRFDAIGRLRDRDEHGKPIDTSGVLPDGGQRFDGAPALAALLAESEDARTCILRQWFRFGLARPEGDADTHSLGAAYSSYAEAGHDVRAFLTALATTRSFRYRKLEPGETVEVMR